MNSSIQTEFKAGAKYSICSNICSGIYIFLSLESFNVTETLKMCRILNVMLSSRKVCCVLYCNIMTVFRYTVHKFIVIHRKFYCISIIITYFSVLTYFMNYQKKL